MAIDSTASLLKPFNPFNLFNPVRGGVTLHNAPELLALPKVRRVGVRITQLAPETAQLKKNRHSILNIGNIRL